jgi:hypothetical protein
MMRSAAAAMKPSMTGVGDRPHEKAEPGGGEYQSDDADHQRQRGGELDVGGRERLGEVVQRAQHQDGHDADGAGEQQAVAAEGDRQGGSGAAGVEAVDGRNAGDDGVGHRLGQHGQSEVGAGGGVVSEAAERRAAVREVRVPPHAAIPFAARSKSIGMKLDALASRQARQLESDGGSALTAGKRAIEDGRATGTAAAAIG